MRQWLTAKRRRIILAGVLAAVLPPLLLVLFIYSEIYNHVSEWVMADNLQTARLVASRIEERLASDAAFARAYAARPYLIEGLQRGDMRELDRHLQNLIENDSNIERAFIASPAGILLADWPKDPATLGKDFSQRDWYQGVSKDWQPYVSEFYLRTAKPQRYLFAIAVPIKAEGGTVGGILVLQPKADYLKEMRPQEASGDGQTSQGHAYVVDGKGKVIDHPELLQEAMLDFSNRPGVQRLLRGEDGTDISVCPVHKEKEIIAYVPVKKVGWGVVIYKSQHQALAPFHHILYGILGFAAVMIVLGGLVAYRVADLFARTTGLNRELAEKEAAEKAYSEFLTLLNLPWSELEELGESSVRQICEETCVEAGVFYLGREGHPVPYAAFGVPKPLHRDGLAQACLTQGKTISLVEIPPDSHLTLHTGVGVFMPREILVVPLQYQNETIGVIELACLHGLNELDREIIDRLAPRLAIAIRILTDNLEKAQIARELAQSYEEMQAVNEELTVQQQELVQLNLRLEEASRAKSDFLANMSHELRTPLNSILGFSEVLQNQLFGLLNEKQQEYVNYILGSGKHLLALINDILDLAKVEAGKMILEAGILPLQDLLESAMNMLKEKAIKHGIALELDLDPAVAEELVEADERKIKQILFNLLSNAVKFTPDGGAVRVRAERDGDFFKIIVADTGIGIKPEDIDRLFHSFTQLESPYSKKYEGTGLGLALTKKLVELHGGRIWVESEEGKGSSFSFIIPVRQPDQLPSSSGPDKKGTTGEREKTALVIEDDPLAASIVETSLVDAGFAVVKTANGRDGITAAQENPPGLIILDLMMPGMNGFEVLAALRSQENIAGIPVIVLTAMALSPEDKERLLARGAQAVVEKGSLDREEFIATVRRVTG
jgi:signal transduction histidine kinase